MLFIVNFDLELTRLAFLLDKGRLLVKVLEVVVGFLIAAVVVVLVIDAGGAIVVGLAFLLLGCPTAPSNLKTPTSSPSRVLFIVLIVGRVDGAGSFVGLEIPLLGPGIPLIFN